MNKRSIIAERVLIPLGLFMTCGTFLLSHDWIKMPDTLSGGLTGFGIGLMIVGIVKVNKRPKHKVE